MPSRLRTRTVTFARPFFLDDVNRELPAGAYIVETEEEMLDVSSFLSYRRAGTRLFVPAVAGESETEMWVVDPQALDSAIAQDRAASAATD
jgi:hypothetical protein